MRRRGAIEREAPSAVRKDQTPSIWCRLGSEHGYSVGWGPVEQQAGGETLAVRDWRSLLQPARRRLQGGEVRIELSAAALPDNDRAERSGFVETVFSNFFRTVSGAPQPFPYLQREIA